MKNRLVSIGMPLLNEGKYLSETLDSLLAQSFSDFEIIISDNASTDETAEIANNYVKKDQRVRYYRSDHRVGGNTNFNRVFQLSSGKYFMWVSGHDLWHKDFVSSCLYVLEKEPKVVLAYPLMTRIGLADDDSLIIVNCRLDTRSLTPLLRFNLLIWGLANGNPVLGLIRSEALRQTRLFHCGLGADMVLLSELCLIGEFAHVQEQLFYRRNTRPSENLSQATQRRAEDTYEGKKKILSLFPWWHLAFKQLLVVRRTKASFFYKMVLFITAFLGLMIIYHKRMYKDFYKFYKNVFTI